MEYLKELNYWLYDNVTIYIFNFQGFREYVIKVSKDLNSTDLFIMVMFLYVNAIVKEFIISKLYLNYKMGLLTAVKTTIMLLIFPISSVGLIYHYSLIKFRDLEE